MSFIKRVIFVFVFLLAGVSAESVAQNDLKQTRRQVHAVSRVQGALPCEVEEVSTHRPQLLEWADTVAVIEAGQCVLMGPKQEMIEKLSRGLDVKTAAPNGVPA